MQRAEHHDAEATELPTRVEAGRKEITELRARAAVAGGQHRGDRGPAGRDRRGGRRQRARVRGSRRGCRTSGARRWRRRARELEAAHGARSRPRARASPAARPSGRRRRSGATIWRRGWRPSPPRRPRPASGWRRSSARSAGMRDEIDGLRGPGRRARGARATEDEARLTARARRDLGAASWSSRRCARRRTAGARAWRR